MKEIVAGIIMCLYVVMWVGIAWFFLDPALGMVSALTHVVQSFGDYIASQT